MHAFKHVYTETQATLDEPYVLSVEEILAPEYVSPAAEDLVIANSFWARKAEAFSANMTKNAIFQAWRNGALGSVEAFNALVAYDVMDFEIVVGLYADYSAALAMGESV